MNSRASGAELTIIRELRIAAEFHAVRRGQKLQLRFSRRRGHIPLQRRANRIVFAGQTIPSLLLPVFTEIRFKAWFRVSAGAQFPDYNGGSGTARHFAPITSGIGTSCRN